MQTVLIEGLAPAGEASLGALMAGLGPCSIYRGGQSRAARLVFKTPQEALLALEMIRQNCPKGVRATLVTPPRACAG